MTNEMPDIGGPKTPEKEYNIEKSARVRLGRLIEAELSNMDNPDQVVDPKGARLYKLFREMNDLAWEAVKEADASSESERSDT